MSEYFARLTGNEFPTALSPSTQVGSSDSTMPKNRSLFITSSSVDVARKNIESSIKEYASSKRSVVIKRYGIK